MIGETMKNYMMELKTLLNIKSPTGHTAQAIDHVDAQFKAMGLPTRRTNKNALIATLKGHDLDEAITFSAHVDTLGCMVKEITPNGRLRLTQIGGYAWTTIEGEHVTIETIDGTFYTGQIVTTVASSHVHGAKTNATERNADTLEVRIDEKVFTADDVHALGIQVSDYVHLDPRTQISESGFIKSRHLDDKACVISLIETARYFTENHITPDKTIHFFISNYEEVGHGSSAAIPANTKEFIAVDMAAPGAGQTSDEFSVTICAKDSTGPYDYALKQKLVQLAKKEGIPYKLDIYPFYGSDASAAQRAGNDVRAALIGPGVDASHSFERTHQEAIQATTDLMIAFIKA